MATWKYQILAKKTDYYEENAPYGQDGRWRWMLFDTDHGFNSFRDSIGDTGYVLDYTHNTIEWLLDESRGEDSNGPWSTFLFRKVISNESFKNDFLNRMNDLMNTIFLEEEVNEKIDELMSNIENEMPHHINRWGVIPSINDWVEKIEDQREFAQERPNYMRTHLMNEFDIENTYNITVNNESEMGYIRKKFAIPDDTLRGIGGWKSKAYLMNRLEMTLIEYLSILISKTKRICNPVPTVLVLASNAKTFWFI